MKKLILLALISTSAFAQYQVGSRNAAMGAHAASALTLGTTQETSLQAQNQNYYQLNYVVTGANAAGYSVNSCSTYVGAIGQTAYKIDCVVIAAAGTTTTASSVLCHGTYTETTSPNAFVSIPLTGCGTLAASTGYWIGINTNDNSVQAGFYNCGGSCTGSAGSATYQAWYETVTYGTYTGLPTAAMTGVGNLQSSTYLTVVPN
jgi:hypothetical protein